MSSAIEKRVARQDWQRIGDELDRFGHAGTGRLLGERECRDLIRLYDDDARFRSTVVMERHAYGLGEYRYFGYPLPPLVAALRRALYAPLAEVAQRWAEQLATGEGYPPRLEDFLETCRAAGQGKATPLLLRYREGGYNCLHQDRYGEVAFPLQAAILLSRPGRDFTGGELLLVEQRPRAQSRGEAVALEQGHAILFANAVRPAAGKRGFHRVTLRHGVSRLRSGERLTLGIIFHDAR